MLQSLLEFFISYGYFAVFGALIICGLGLPLPEDLTLIAGGAICGFVGKNGLVTDVNVYVMTVVALLGVLVGDTCMFTLGWKLGERVTKFPGIRRIITKKNYAKIQTKIHKHGVKILFIARFLPGMRAGIFLTTGMTRRVSIWKFLALDGAAALISVPALVYMGYYFANDLDRIIKIFDKWRYIIIGVVLISIIIWLGIRHFSSKKPADNNTG